MDKKPKFKKEPVCRSFAAFFTLVSMEMHMDFAEIQTERKTLITYQEKPGMIHRCGNPFAWSKDYGSVASVLCKLYQDKEEFWIVAWPASEPGAALNRGLRLDQIQRNVMLAGGRGIRPALFSTFGMIRESVSWSSELGQIVKAQLDQHDKPIDPIYQQWPRK